MRWVFVMDFNNQEINIPKTGTVVMNINRRGKLIDVNMGIIWLGAGRQRGPVKKAKEMTAELCRWHTKTVEGNMMKWKT
jgi:hypothetical protein